MPIFSNELDDFVEQEDFSHGIGFNPVENIRTMVSEEFNPSGFSSVTQEISQSQTVREFEEMMRLSRDLGIARFREEAVKIPKQKHIAKILDEVSEENKDIFNSLNKVQAEIETLEKQKLIELAEKYDSMLFIIIGKSYSLKGVSEKQKLGYYNTLTQQLFSTIRGVTVNEDYTIIDFKHLMLRHVSRFVVLDNEDVSKYNTLFEELYEYYNTIKAKKKEKHSLMGREDKKSTVCEDYINFNTNSSRTISGGARISISI